MSEEKKEEKKEKVEDVVKKTETATAEIQAILDKHNLTMRVAQNIQIVPKQ